jgi:DNA-nicking Smr family endonuclease
MRDDEEDESVVVPIEDHIDLHSFAPRDVRSVVEAYLEAAIAAGFREVRLIHGRGLGVQRASVRALLERHPAVVSYQDDDVLRGGRGATLVVLAPRRD